MLFNSWEFIFLFLPLCISGSFLLGHFGFTRAASLWLSATSLLFYAWWNPDPNAPWSPSHIFLIIGSIVFNYLTGVGISSATGCGARRRAKLLLALGIAADLGVLVYFKYSAFLTANINGIFGTDYAVVHLALPLAISFFTFTQIAYLVDAYHGVTREFNFRWYLLFVTFFPHLIAGPIVLYRSLMPQFTRPDVWRFNPGNFAGGLSLFAFGLFKKSVIADTIAPMANAVFAISPSGPSPTAFVAWIGVIAYTLQLYFDFSGYSDMAIGLGKMFNVRFPANFNSPYKSRDIIDFWRRWHISLSLFLRDHLYIPLGGNRRGPLLRHVNLFVTMLLGGLWHGAGWNFVAWGALHGVFLVVNHAWLGASKSWSWAGTLAARCAGRILTMLAIMVGWVFFRSADLSQAASMLSGMTGFHGAGLPSQIRPVLANLGIPSGFTFSPMPFEWHQLALLAAAVFIVFAAPNTEQIFRIAILGKPVATVPAPLWKPTAPWAMLTAFALAFSIFKLSGVTEFLYFQF